MTRSLAAVLLTCLLAPLMLHLARGGHHMSTKDEGERSAAIVDGWSYEGITGYVLENPTSGAHWIYRYHNVAYADFLYGT